MARLPAYLMQLRELIVLLPCHSLEDFPVHQQGAEADGLLAAWSALWHPALLASSQKLPLWYRADEPPDDLGARLIVIPPVAESLLLAGWTARAKSEGAVVVRKKTNRDEILSIALAELDEPRPEVPTDLAADFLALGTGYLLVELLTRQMRYMSNLDEVHLQNETLAAAREAVAGNAEKAREHLGNCFDALMEARERFYPVETYLIDLTLLAGTTLGPSLRSDLAKSTPGNYLVSGQLLEQMREQQPESLAALRAAVESGSACHIGGEAVERELPLLPPESALWELQQGRAIAQRLLGQPPVIYGRRRFGLTPTLPQMLSRLGFQGALHFTLEDGRFPTPDQTKTTWEGFDSSTLEILAKLPLDAQLPESVLRLPERLGDSMDHDMVASLLFAHWPGMVSPFYDDVRRITAYRPVFGRFVTLADFMQNTDHAGDITRFRADQYRSEYLRQAIIRQQPDPLSRHARHQSRRLAVDSLAALETLATLVENAALSTDAAVNEMLGGKASALVDEVEHADQSRDAADAQQQATLRERLDARITTARQQAAERLARDIAGAGSSERGLMVLNPLSFKRRVLVDAGPLGGLPNVAEPVIAAQEHLGRRQVLVEVPSMGFAWVAAGNGPSPAARGARPMAEENLLRNEHFELTINPTTGGIKGLFLPGRRGNQLSQQLAMRLSGDHAKAGQGWHDPGDESYSVMACDGVEVIGRGPAAGELLVKGRLLDPHGAMLASYEQHLTLARGARVVVIDVKLDVQQVPRADPWNSYYAARFAWPRETVEMRRSVALTAQPTTARRLEAPHYIELRDDELRLALLTGGLPYHLRSGTRMLDVLLHVRGESQQRFRLGVGIDLPNVAQEALSLLDSALVVENAPPPASRTPSAWLFHVDRGGVVATHWQAVLDRNASGESRPVGFRVRLLETAGRAGRTQLRAMRPVASARLVDYTGRPLVELPTEGDRVSIDMTRYEWSDVEVRWAE